MHLTQVDTVFGMRGGEILHVSEVERGLKCDCYCVECGGALIAKKGKIKHHFAHKSLSTCTGGGESVLHLFAKRVISQMKTMMLPKYVFQRFQGNNEILKAQQEVDILKVEVEQRVGAIRPDLKIYTNLGLVYLEIYVTHKVSEDKTQRIRDLDLAVLEIDLSVIARETDLEDLRGLLQDGLQYKHWVHVPELTEYQQALDVLGMQILLDAQGRIQGTCPLAVYWQQQGKLNNISAYKKCDATKHCVMCNYAYRDKDISEEQAIICGAGQFISKFTDISVNLAKRQASQQLMLSNTLERYKTTCEVWERVNQPYSETKDTICYHGVRCKRCGKTMILVYRDNKWQWECNCTRNKHTKALACKWCGEHMTIRFGPTGHFLGCTDYPGCTFTANLRCNECGSRLDHIVRGSQIFLRCSSAGCDYCVDVPRKW